MGKIKDSEPKSNVHVLSEREWNYLKMLNQFLTYHTMQQRLMSGFLYHLCNTRFGYGDNVNLIFEADLEKDDRKLIVKEISDEVIEQELQKGK